LHKVRTYTPNDESLAIRALAELAFFNASKDVKKQRNKETKETKETKQNT
jgi:hypothetical protein